jgi:hypothetical protein
MPSSSDFIDTEEFLKSLAAEFDGKTQQRRHCGLRLGAGCAWLLKKKQAKVLEESTRPTVKRTHR